MLRHAFKRSLRLTSARPGTSSSSLFNRSMCSATEEMKEVVEADPSPQTSNVRIEVGRMQVKGSTKKNNRLAQFVRVLENFSLLDRPSLHHSHKQLRGMYVEDALAQLYFTKKKRRREAFIHVIKRGVTRAKLEHNLPQNRLRIAETYVTKGQMLKRPKFHARGRTGKNYHRFSHIKMVLEEAEELPVLGRRDEDTTKNNWRSKFKNGTVPKDLADFPMDLVFPYRVKKPHFTNKAV